jgi:hypothetical protein
MNDDVIDLAACACVGRWMRNQSTVYHPSDEEVAGRWDSWDDDLKKPWRDIARAALSVINVDTLATELTTSAAKNMIGCDLDGLSDARKERLMNGFTEIICKALGQNGQTMSDNRNIVDIMAEKMLARRGFGYYADPTDSRQRHDIACNAKEDILAALSVIDVNAVATGIVDIIQGRVDILSKIDAAEKILRKALGQDV